jgi:signal transduction histidine kinase
MTIAARLNGGITQLAVGRHLPHRTARIRLTFLYGGLFLLSGAALMAIAYALLANAGFVFTLHNAPSTGPITGGRPNGSLGEPPLTRGKPPGALRRASVGYPAPGSRTHPSAETMAYWQGVSRCMRRHGISRFPDPQTTVPRGNLFDISELSDRDGAILVFPATFNMQSSAFTGAADACGFMDDSSKMLAEANRRRADTRQELLAQSGIALAAMSLLSLGLGWVMAGRVLTPLEDSYHAQRQFVANASHELRAPLTRLRALSEVALASSEANVASLRTAHERVLASEQHLEQLIDALLALTRGQAGLERRDHLDLATLTSQALLAQESQLAGLDLHTRATLDLAPIAGDPRLLERMIDNLIDNATRHNTPGGHLEITTGTRDRHAFVSIANTGPSIPPEEIQRLFQPFQRLDAVRTRHNKGHGLGLAIVQAIANAHRAELRARAQPEGGLAIEVSFPPAIGAGSGQTFTTARTKRGSSAISETDVPARG